MTVIQRLVAPALVGLLLAALLGLDSTGDQARAAGGPLPFTERIMIPAAAFIPARDGIDYDNWGERLTVSGAGWGLFTAPLSFPPLDEVSLRRITLYAFDNGSGVNVCASVHRTSPAAPKKTTLGAVCTSNSAADPQVVATAAISPRTVKPAIHGTYLEIYLDPNVRFYGVAVTYAYDV